MVSFTKNLVERIQAQNKRGYTIERKTRRKSVLPVSKKPLQPQQNETTVQKDPTDQKELKQEKKIEQKKHVQKMKSDSNTSKTIKDGRKAGTHKCIFSYTEQEYPADAEKVKAKKSVKKGQVSFDDEFHILRGNEDPELFCKWVAFLEERFFLDPDDYSTVEWDTLDRTIMQIVAGEAKEVVKATLSKLHPKKTGYTLGTLKLFTNGYVKKELTDMCDTKNELKVLLHKQRQYP